MAVVEMRLCQPVQLNSTWPVGNDSVCSVCNRLDVSECQTQCNAAQERRDADGMGWAREREKAFPFTITIGRD